MTRFSVVLVISALMNTSTPAQEEKSTTITVMIRGVATDKDAQALRAALKKIDGISFNENDLQRGEKGRFKHHFSSPFEIKLEDLNKADVGAIAKVVAETKTPSRKEIEPSLNLVFFDPRGRIGEIDVVALRDALAQVNGVEGQVRGGVGGVVAEGRMWVRLEAAGGANLPFILDALQKADLDLKLTKP